ncbi:FecR family protein [Pontimicrobium sp. MEBiC06410]
MRKESFDETFLARWIAGELTPEETRAFKESKHYLEYKKINNGMNMLEMPSYNHEANLAKLYNTIDNKANTTKVKKLIPNWIYKVAAVLIVALGIMFFNNTNEYETNFGEQEVVTLPDNSKVYLNANSILDFNKGNWANNRVLEFNGEGFFDVEKGTKFSVQSSEGLVEVLGTEFNVISRKDYLEVKCHEGKVKVSTINDNNITTTTVLTVGDAVRVVDNVVEKWNFNEEKPTWLSGESSFKDTPLTQVIKSLENQYNLEVNPSGVDLNKRFTGSFTHKDVKIALQTVFGPMHISYSVDSDNTITLK